VLLLDEPASGLDPSARIHMRELLRRLADSGKCVLVSSHILPELAAICDTIGIIHQGKLRVAGPINDVLRQLQRDRLMEVRCTDGTDGDAKQILDRQIRCSDVAPAELDPAALRFKFSGDDEGLAGVLDALKAGGVRVVTFREVPLSLEDAYMAISGLGDEESNQPANQPTGAEEATS
jgi:ABC-2 type transport system ATP-binding protein